VVLAGAVAFVEAVSGVEVAPSVVLVVAMEAGISLMVIKSGIVSNTT
jgi:hypothetical protein